MASGDFTRINTNIGALNALNSLKYVQKNLGTAQLRLATGKRINEAADDPAGLTIATKFRYRASGLGVALDNIGDAKNMLAVAEGGLTKINDILVQMRDKSQAAASDTLGTSERAAIKAQLDQFTAEIDDIVQTTQWNGNKLLDGLTSFTGGIHFQVGVDAGGAGTGNQIVLDGTNFGGVTTGASDLNIGTSTSSASVSGSTAVVYTAATAAVDSTSAPVLSELASGSYTVEVTIGSTDGSATDSVIRLKDFSGNYQLIDLDGSAGDGTGYGLTFAADNSGTQTINFQNGLTVTLATNIAQGDSTGTVSYTRSTGFFNSVDTASNAQTAITRLQTAIGTVSSQLQTLGAYVSRLNFREETLTTAKVNTEAAYSRIMDADMASEQLEATKAQILQQTATAMLSQANQAPQGILQLFR